MEKDTDKIALDFTYSSGQLKGLNEAIEMIETIKEIVDED